MLKVVEWYGWYPFRFESCNDSSDLKSNIPSRYRFKSHNTTILMYCFFLIINIIVFFNLYLYEWTAFMFNLGWSFEFDLEQINEGIICTPHVWLNVCKANFVINRVFNCFRVSSSLIEHDMKRFYLWSKPQRQWQVLIFMIINWFVYKPIFFM